MANGSDFDYINYEPSFVEDGYGISGPQGDYVEEDLQDWDLNAWSQQEQEQDFTGVSGSGLTVQTRDAGGFGAIIQQVTGVTTITYDSAVFLIQDNGGGEVVVYCA